MSHLLDTQLNLANAVHPDAFIFKKTFPVLSFVKVLYQYSLWWQPAENILVFITKKVKFKLFFSRRMHILLVLQSPKKFILFFDKFMLKKL